MSTPQNILAKYRSYSYHHILIACDNEASAEYIRSANRLSVFRQIGSAQAVTITEEDKIVEVDRLDEASGQKEQIRIGAYVVILNGLIDTQFVIRSAKWFTTTAASADANDKFTSLAVEGSMIVEEPRGVRFMNALNGACNQLGSDPTGVIWMLKTIFVGHGVTAQGEEFTDHITDLRPLEFMIYDVTGTFDITGGVYQISFAGAANGAARFPQFSRVAEEISFTPKGVSLTESLATLELYMNDKSSRNRTCVIDALKRTYSNVDGSKLEQFRRVDYRIILEDPYTTEAYVLDGWNDIERDNVNGPGSFKFGKSSTVEQAIRHILERCSRVKKDLTEGDENGIKYSFKIHSEITMVGKGTRNPLTRLTSNEDIVLVVYRIRRFAEVTNQTVQRVLNLGTGGSVDEQTNQAIIDQNLITFDYFFSGKNTDILDFDLKMEMGLAFLQTLASTNNIGTGTSQIQGLRAENAIIIVPTENARGDPSNDTPSLLIRSKTPIFPATNVKNVLLQNVAGAHDTTLYTAMLSRHAAIESIEATVTIHGNPYLMSQTNRRPSDGQRKLNSQGEEGDPTRVLQNWDTIPGLAKVNIFMPATNDTPSSQNRFDRERFWYDGYYYIYGIDHEFDSGIFKQNLHMISLANESLIFDRKTTDISECGESIIQQPGQGDTAPTEAQTEPLVTEVRQTYGRSRPGPSAQQIRQGTAGG